MSDGRALSAWEPPAVSAYLIDQTKESTRLRRIDCDKELAQSAIELLLIHHAATVHIPFFEEVEHTRTTLQSGDSSARFGAQPC